MIPSKPMRILTTILVLTFAATLSAATPYHLELEATPEAAFPYLGRFGKVDLHVYAGGVRGEALWLHGFSREGSDAITVVNPLARMYVEVPLDDIAPVLTRLAGSAGKIERDAVPTLGPTLEGKVKDIPATRHRFLYGPDAWIDVWTTDVIPANLQLLDIVDRIVTGISPGTAKFTSELTATPIYVELNFRRFKKVPLVKFKKLTMAAENEEDALTLGKMYVRATVLEKLFTK